MWFPAECATHWVILVRLAGAHLVLVPNDKGILLIFVMAWELVSW